MTSPLDNGPIAGPPRSPSQVESTRPEGVTRGVPSAQEGPAFRSLLTDLQAKTAALRESSRDVGDRIELRGAVDSARATLEDALSLGEHVLEAFRSAQQARQPGAQPRAREGTQK